MSARRKSLKTRKIIGLLIFLFGISLVTYPFLSMSIDDFTQYERNREFEEEISRDRHINDKIKKLYDRRNRTKTSNTQTNSSNENIRDVFAGEDSVNIEKNDLRDLGINLNKKVGFVSIPKLGQSFDLYLDANYEKIAKGVAVLSESDLPVGGKGKRTVIAGHSGYYNKVMFLNIYKLQSGDSIIVNFLGKKIEYKVYGMEKIYPEQGDKLKPIESEDTLTLLTCTQAPRYDMRLLVNARRVADNVQTKSVNNTIANDSIVEYISDKNVEPAIKIRKIFPYVISAFNIILIIIILLKLYRVIKSK